MGKKNKNEQEEAKVVVAEFKVSMHCNACERIVAKTLLKIKGVEKFGTDMNNHKVVVTGKIDPEKILKKLRKKTGKRVEIIDDKEEEQNAESDEGNLSRPLIVHPLMFDCCKESDQLLLMFSDENPNACSIM
uniref:heavy metal-associated isoprenylated plant protein 26-like n=1 Tax=Fragaria vesca subsp. vesca TaxID=101020 RepID=UPI0005C8B2CD|nr:PREDICTED: heavy metal-associated isoprenylated plant protein 26-like [Fragaria vesca subsp. vesca]